VSLDEPAVSLDEEVQEILNEGRYQTEPPDLRETPEPIDFDLPFLGPVAKMLVVAAAAGLVLVIAALIFERSSRIGDARPSTDSSLGPRAPPPPSLAEAERQASAGHFGDAAHVLLQRAIFSIGRSGEPVRKSLTSRELLRKLGSDPKREPLGLLVGVVEDHLFRGLEIASDRYQACLRAYAELSGEKEATEA